MAHDEDDLREKPLLRGDRFVHGGLLSLDADNGKIEFGGRRSVLMDAVAMGMLRKGLVENFGPIAARAVLTQFGFAQGWRTADALQSSYTWDSEHDWASAGTRIHVLEGLFNAVPGSAGPLSPHGLTFDSSYEVEQQLLHFGRAESPICWTICGLMSGYLSRSTGKDIFVFEDRCVGAGDAACHVHGRTREEWGESRAAELAFFEQAPLTGCLDASMRRMIETLRTTQHKLRHAKRTMTKIAPEFLDDPSGLVVKSRPMIQLVEFARRVAKVDTTVLIVGESGVGKERIARLVHEESARASGPFVGVNCGAITETLLESELFGHARGAFTGASHDRPGFFEAAHRGTLLLDEIGDISPGMQVRLLRVLQEREVRRVGENKSRPIDVRVMSATNRNLASAVATGLFRQDLYYRLNVVQLDVPALRNRNEDRLPLARILLAVACRRMGRPLLAFTPAAADQIARHDWPGNVRELENAMERAAALARGARVTVEDLPEEARGEGAAHRPEQSGVRALDAVLRDHIVASLALNDGNQTRTAAQLGIGSATLYRKLKSYGLTGSSKAKSDPGHEAEC